MKILFQRISEKPINWKPEDNNENNKTIMRAISIMK